MALLLRREKKPGSILTGISFNQKGCREKIGGKHTPGNDRLSKGPCFRAVEEVSRDDVVLQDRWKGKGGDLK